MSDTSTGDQKLRVCKLAEAALLGEATTDQIAELEQLVTQDDEAREFYVRYIHDANNLRDFATASSVPEGAAELIDREFLARLWREDAMVAKSAARPKAFAVVIVLALTLTVGVGFWFMRAPPSPIEEKGLLLGREIVNRRMTQNHGVVRVQMGNGSFVYVEGPSEFTVTDDRSVTLHRGRLVGEVPQGVYGLNVIAGSATVTDLGTEFGVSFEPGKPIEVQVFEGFVELKPKGAAAVSVAAGQARSVVEDVVHEIEFDQTRYTGLRTGRRYAQEAGRGALGYWRFEELADGSAVLIDQVYGVPDVEDAYADVNAVPGAEGLGGTAAEFDGAKSVITIPHDERFSTDDISVSFWFRSTQQWKIPEHHSNPKAPAIISKATEGMGSGDWAIRGVRGGRVRVGVGPKGGPPSFLHSTTALNDGRWHHVVWTRDRHGLNYLYIDGIVDDKERDEGGSILNSRAIQVGGDTLHTNSGFFEGVIDEVSIYGSVLTPEQVRRFYEIEAFP